MSLKNKAFPADKIDFKKAVEATIFSTNIYFIEKTYFIRNEL